MLKLYSSFTHPKGWRFIIEQDSQVGFYLYVYEQDSPFLDDLRSSTGCWSHQQDHLQDTLKAAKNQALQDFGVPVDSWVEIKPDTALLKL